MQCSIINNYYPNIKPGKKTVINVYLTLFQS
jgi:hypothetical protein